MTLTIIGRCRRTGRPGVGIATLSNRATLPPQDAWVRERGRAA